MKILITTIVLVLLLTACSKVPFTPKTTEAVSATVHSLTQTASQTLVPTAQTPTETVTATATSEGVDLEMFHRVPESYVYLLQHPNEFVQSPDPIAERAAFDKWITEVLYPAIGPRTERQVNVVVDALGKSNWAYNAWPSSPTPVQGELLFFTFESGGVQTPVLCANVACFDPQVVDQTLCVGLFDGSPNGSGTGNLERLAAGRPVQHIDIYKIPSPEGVFQGDWAKSFLKATGDAWINLPDNLAFGIGMFKFQE